MPRLFMLLKHSLSKGLFVIGLLWMAGCGFGPNSPPAKSPGNRITRIVWSESQKQLAFSYSNFKKSSLEGPMEYNNYLYTLDLSNQQLKLVKQFDAKFESQFVWLHQWLENNQQFLLSQGDNKGDNLYFLSINGNLELISQYIRDVSGNYSLSQDKRYVSIHPTQILDLNERTIKSLAFNPPLKSQPESGLPVGIGNGLNWSPDINRVYFSYSWLHDKTDPNSDKTYYYAYATLNLEKGELTDVRIFKSELDAKGPLPKFRFLGWKDKDTIWYVFSAFHADLKQVYEFHIPSRSEKPLMLMPFKWSQVHSISPDLKQVVFEDEDKGGLFGINAHQALYIANLDGSNKREILNMSVLPQGVERVVAE